MSIEAPLQSGACFAGEPLREAMPLARQQLVNERLCSRVVLVHDEQASDRTEAYEKRIW